jgi:tRNA/tmRNA/rRNA uracil-C5-methylase (TrmA/RlmC/RlmD family)
MALDEHPQTTKPLEPGDEIELEVTNIAHGGVSVARHGGRVVFVTDAIPGERVIARVTEARKKSFARASVIELLEASPHRRAHIWPEASVDHDPEHRVGGAEFGHIDLAHQRELKAFVLTDSLKRMAGIDRDVAVQAAPGDDERNGLGWRTRVRLHVDEQGRVGPYAARSNTVISVGSLPLAVEAINNIAPLDELIADAEAVDLIAPSSDADELGDPRMLVSYRTGPAASAVERIGANDMIRERVGEREFVLHAGGFWQVHREAPGVLTRAVAQAVTDAIDANEFDADAHNLDLYGGVGLLAAAMGDVAGSRLKVTSVESDPLATDYAAENLSEWVGARAVTARVDQYLRQLIAEANPTMRERVRKATVVLDPPRTGAAGEVTSALIELSPKRLIYVACDPVALARDVASLTAGGYELRSVDGYDLFPHTHHVEAMAVLVREGI